jgi:hypothetical protein
MRSTMLALLVLGCRPHASEPKSDPVETARPAPPAPENGAPIAMLAGELSPGLQGGAVHVDAYNFSARTLSLYDVSIRYRDATGIPLRFLEQEVVETDAAHASFTGGSYVCKPHQWCSFTVTASVPQDAATAQIEVIRVKAVAADGVHDDTVFPVPG